MEIFQPFLDLNNLKFFGKSNGMHEFSSKQLFIIVSYFVYEMYHCVPGCKSERVIEINRKDRTIISNNRLCIFLYSQGISNLE